MATPPDQDLCAALARVEHTRRLADQLVRDPQGADDVAQEALIAAWQRPARGSWRAWLAAITRNKAREARRRDARRARAESKPADESHGQSPLDLAVRAETHKQLVDAVMSLPDPYRTVIWRRYFDGASPRAIARERNVSLETIRTQLRRGRERLRTQMDATHDGDRMRWRVALLPLPAIKSELALATTLGGGAYMGAKLKWGIGLAVAAAILTMTTLIDFSGPGTPAGKAVGEPRPLQGSIPPREAPLLVPTTVDAVDDDEPAHALAIDRDRDVHGKITNPDGQPVGGATLQIVRYPWRYNSLITDGKHNDRIDGPTTQSRADGTFALRTRRGAFVHLLVKKEGFATTEYARVSAGERVEIVLQPAVRVHVEVLDPDGRTADGVHVRLFQSALGNRSIHRVATTDESGSCTFDDLPPGMPVYLELHVQREGWGCPTWQHLTLPESGDDTLRVRLPRGRTLRGRVVDAESQAPIADARVGMNWTLRRIVRTDRDGRFLLHGWTGQGVHALHVAAAGYGRESAAVGNDDTYAFALRKAQRIVGEVRDAQGALLEGAWVSAQGGGSMANVRTGADGAFALADLHPHRPHTVVVSAPGHGRMVWVFDPPDAGNERDVGSLVLPAAREVQGRVLDAQRNPLVGVRVSIRRDSASAAEHPQASEKPPDHFYGGSLERRSDDLGRFRFVDLAPGRFEIVAQNAGGDQVQQRVHVRPDRMPDPIELLLGVGRSVLVRTVDEDGSAMPNVIVYAEHPGTGGRSATTGRDGTVDFAVSPHARRIRVFPQGDLLEPPAQAVDKATREVTFVMRRAVPIEGVVVRDDGTPIPHATIEARQADRVISFDHADPQGRFRIPLPKDTRVALHFAGKTIESAPTGLKRRMVPWTAKLDDVESGTKAVRLVARGVASDRTLHVRVVDPDGSPVSGCTVLLGSNEASKQTDAQGHATFQELVALPTRVSVRFQPNADVPWLRPDRQAATPDGQTITFHLRTAAVVQGVLRAPGGDPLRGTIRVRMGDRLLDEIYVPPTGQFRVRLDPALIHDITLEGLATVEGQAASITRGDLPASGGEITIQFAARH